MLVRMLSSKPNAKHVFAGFRSFSTVNSNSNFSSNPNSTDESSPNSASHFNPTHDSSPTHGAPQLRTRSRIDPKFSALAGAARQVEANSTANDSSEPAFLSLSTSLSGEGEASAQSSSASPPNTQALSLLGFCKTTILTLNPYRMVELGQEPVDLTGHTAAYVRVSFGGVEGVKWDGQKGGDGEMDHWEREAEAEWEAMRMRESRMGKKRDRSKEKKHKWLDRGSRRKGLKPSPPLPDTKTSDPPTATSTRPDHIWLRYKPIRAQMPSQEFSTQSFVKWLPFPGGTRGVLYYHVPSPKGKEKEKETYELRGEVRFRILASEPDPDVDTNTNPTTAFASAFRRGYDLHRYHDTSGAISRPYGIPLLAIVHTPTYHPLLRLLLAEMHVSASLVDDLKKLKSPREKVNKRKFQVLYGLRDEWVLNFDEEMTVLVMVSRSDVRKLEVKGIWKEEEYAGKALVRFRPSKDNKMLQIEYLKLLTPFKRLHSHPQSHLYSTSVSNALKEPVPGELLMKMVGAAHKVKREAERDADRDRDREDGNWQVRWKPWGISMAGRARHVAGMFGIDVGKRHS